MTDLDLLWAIIFVAFALSWLGIGLYFGYGCAADKQRPITKDIEDVTDAPDRFDD